MTTRTLRSGQVIYVNNVVSPWQQVLVIGRVTRKTLTLLTDEVFLAPVATGPPDSLKLDPGDKVKVDGKKYTVGTTASGAPKLVPEGQLVDQEGLKDLLAKTT